MSTLKELGIIELEMRIGLDTYHPKVRVTQYDSGLTLEYDIIDRNGEVVTSLPDVVPVLYVESPDKSAIGSAEGEIVDGKAIIPIPGSLLSKFGEAEAQVQLVNATTKEQIHDNTFILDIAQSKMDGEVEPGESLWFNLQDLKEAIANVHELEQQYDNDVAAVSSMRDDVTSKHGEVTTMHSSLQDVFDSEAARVLAEKARADAEKLRASAETTRANNETKRVTAEKNRVTAETGRVDAEIAREAAEAERKAQYTKSTDLYAKGSALYSKSDPLYTEMKALQQMLGEDPTVELAEQIVKLQEVDADITDVLKAVQHLSDNGKNLYEEAGELYREYVTNTGGIPTLTYDWRGYAITNDIKTWVVPGTQTNGRLYFKAQGSALSHILVYTADEKNMYVAEIDNRTKHYSCDLDLTGGRNVLISTLPAWGQKVKIWDLEVR